MTPDEQAARKAVDVAWDAVTASLDEPQNPAGWAARATAYRDMDRAWTQLLAVVRDDKQIRRAICSAASEARDRAGRFERRIAEVAGR